MPPVIKEKLRNFWIKNRSLIGVLAVLLVVRSTFINQYVVPTGSMIPTISIGDRIFTNRVAFDLKLPFTNIVLMKLGEPERGDVVVFESPKEAGLVLVKRLIGLPGDQIKIDNGFVEVNGTKLDDYNGQNPEHPEYHERNGTHTYLIRRYPEVMRGERMAFTVQPDTYFFMGDNRDHSADGRVFGLVRRELLIGRASRVLFSMDFPTFRFERIGKALD